MLGKYQLIQRLATGGMAEIFLARATAIHGFEKIVVLKKILPQHAQSDDFIRMFLAEARLAATLHHPNIVQVYDIGEHGESYFFTMEYVAGQDLRNLVRAARRAQQPLPLEHILHIIMGVAAGLNHAHEKIGLDGQPLGIVHRDVSPSNVLVTYDGGVKIVDFGIAKAATAQSNTVAGTLKGKIPYMSPEQCRGELVDRRSDIFSIGTLMWELTTGARLFAGDNEFAVINKVAKGEVPLPTTIRGDYPPELEAIVMRALQADRDHRYRSALDLQVDLEDFAREARLPVSSARMAKFMRGLFEDEIRESQQRLAFDRLEEQPTTPRPALSREMLGAGAPPPMQDAVADLTPSEVRHSQMQGTPAPGGLGHAAASATDIRLGEQQRKTSPAVFALALVAAIGLIGGIVATVYLSFFAGSESPTGEERLVPSTIVESPAPAEPVAEPQPEPEPEPEPEIVPVEPEPEPEPEIVVDEPASEEGTAEPESSDESKDDKTDSPAEAPAKRTKKRTKRPTSSGSSGSKPKQWDPDSPFPI